MCKSSYHVDSCVLMCESQIMTRKRTNLVRHGPTTPIGDIAEFFATPPQPPFQHVAHTFLSPKTTQASCGGLSGQQSATSPNSSTPPQPPFQHVAHTLLPPKTTQVSFAGLYGQQPATSPNSSPHNLNLHSDTQSTPCCHPKRRRYLLSVSLVNNR